MEFGFYGHLWAGCLYSGISSGPTLDIEYGKPLPLPFYVHAQHHYILMALRSTTSVVIFFSGKQPWCDRDRLLEVFVVRPRKSKMSLKLSSTVASSG